MKYEEALDREREAKDAKLQASATAAATTAVAVAKDADEALLNATQAVHGAETAYKEKQSELNQARHMYKIILLH